MALLASLTQTVWQFAAALTLLGPFTAIYHPVGIPMLVQGVKRPGATTGVNGLSGNLGIAAAALLTGFLVRAVGWRAAFAGRAGCASRWILCLRGWCQPRPSHRRGAAGRLPWSCRRRNWPGSWWR